MRRVQFHVRAQQLPESAQLRCVIFLFAWGAATSAPFSFPEKLISVSVLVDGLFASTELAMHSAERPFQCTQCDFRSTTKGNLVQHSRAMHQTAVITAPAADVSAAAASAAAAAAAAATLAATAVSAEQ